jgi:hypothetical protein
MQAACPVTARAQIASQKPAPYRGLKELPNAVSRNERVGNEDVRDINEFSIPTDTDYQTFAMVDGAARVLDHVARNPGIVDNFGVAIHANPLLESREIGLIIDLVVTEQLSDRSFATIEIYCSDLRFIGIKE